MSKDLKLLSDETLESLHGGRVGIKKLAQTSGEFESVKRRPDNSKSSKVDIIISRLQRARNKAYKDQYDKDCNPILEEVEA